MYNPKVYPITNKLENDLMEAGIDLTDNTAIIRVIRQMVETVGEYEHGAADVDLVFQGIDADWAPAQAADLDPDSLEIQIQLEQLMAYAQVTMDLILTIHSQS